METRALTNHQLECVARLMADSDFAEFSRILFSEREALLESLTVEPTTERLRSLQGAATTLKEVLEFPGQCREALATRRKAGS